MVDPKKTILARRARFIAAAVAGVAVVACDKPRACLEPPMVTTTAPTSTRPSICLSVARMPPDGSTDDATDAAAPSDAGSGDAAGDAATDAGRKTKPMVGPPPPPRTTI